jgi:hypothetical protein
MRQIVKPTAIPTPTAASAIARPTVPAGRSVCPVSSARLKLPSDSVTARTASIPCGAHAHRSVTRVSSPSGSSAKLPSFTPGGRLAQATRAYRSLSRSATS